MSINVAFSKPMTARFDIESSFSFKVVADEGAQSMRWGKRLPHPYGEYCAQLGVLTKLLFNRPRVDVIVAGRYGDLLALIQGLIPIGRRPLLLLDTEWMIRPRGRFKRVVNRALQRLIASGADRIQVFCQAEARAYSEYYKIPEDKFVWIPYCPPDEEVNVTAVEEEYIFSGGLHHRDFETFYKAVKDLPIEVRVVAPSDQVPSEFRSENMTILGKISREDYFRQMASCKLVVLSLDPVVRFPGVITYVYAMRMGKCVIVNDPIGARSYLEDGKTGRIIAPRDFVGLNQAIVELLRNHQLRQEMGRHAKAVSASEFCSQAYWKRVDSAVKSLLEPREHVERSNFDL